MQHIFHYKTCLTKQHKRYQIRVLLIKAQQKELDVVLMYRGLANLAKDEPTRKTLLRCAADEGKHAAMLKTLTGVNLTPSHTLYRRILDSLYAIVMDKLSQRLAARTGNRSTLHLHMKNQMIGIVLHILHFHVFHIQQPRGIILTEHIITSCLYGFGRLILQDFRDICSSPFVNLFLTPMFKTRSCYDP